MKGERARKLAFWLGSAAVSAGVLLHLPMFFASAGMGYRMTGMSMDAPMTIGLALIGVGLGTVFYGLTPTREQRLKRVRSSVHVSALDEAPLGRLHVALMVVLTAAIAVDAQKPFTFAFILPGVTKEYGLSSPSHHVAGVLSVALYPFVAIVGTTLGSLMWGYVADRMGRRTAILLSAILFIGTAICGAMPSFMLNLVMCFLMGLGVGGLLPTAYALLAETIPARRRGQIVVLVAGVGTGLGFLLTAAVATWLMPHFGWRIMWFFGLPTGLLVIVLNHFIPESPRFLLELGRTQEAEQVMRRFGARLVSDEPSADVAEIKHLPAAYRHRLLGITVALSLYGLGWGIVNFGFLTWLPSIVSTRGTSVAQISGILTNAALFSLPGAVAVSWLYGNWSSKKTMVLVAGLTAASLLALTVFGEALVTNTPAFTMLLVFLLVSLWGVIAVIAPYSAEVYPTRLRGRGAGIAAGATKLGGVSALGMGVAGIAPPGLAGSAALTGGAMAIGALAMAAFGVETRRRRLEEIAPMVPVAAEA